MITVQQPDVWFAYIDDDCEIERAKRSPNDTSKDHEYQSIGLCPT